MKALMIIAQNNFRDEELTEPKAVLEGAGIEVQVASITTNTAKGMLGMEVTPDLAVKDANVDDYDAIVVIGGAGSPELANHKEVLDLLVDAESKGKIIGSICMGPTVLAKAGILKGRKATVFSSGADDVKAGGAVYINQDVVVDGKLVTAVGPAAAKAFGTKLVEVMSG
ncbi:DJ-1/PfpI family protein [Candidatus Woesearchaeota archaeon]|nr:DJ-1/PfpI family protein [Candidatus Woesearchaeota archaeon]